MTIPNEFPPGQIRLNRGVYSIVDLPALFGTRLFELPVVLRLLLENLVRTTAGEEREAAVHAMFGWLDKGSSEAEIAFQPGRVLMHDTTSTPALVDIAAMRDALAEAGADPEQLNPCLPVDISVDHSLAVENYARSDAAELNLAHEIRRNSERYRFLQWAAKALDGVRIHPPGTGIMHTINLEQLATVVSTEWRKGVEWLVPDMMLGTDSHTPMINGLGVLGWGVGGLEAQTVMFGMPTMLRIPDVIGVKLNGRLPPDSQSTDLALTVTQRLREIGVAGDFVEFFGPGVAFLSAGDRAVVANMAPEYGASTGFFPVDERTLDYLRATGRPNDLIERVETYTRHNGLWFDPEAQARYTRTISIDLSTIGLRAAGPCRPQDLLDYAQIPDALRRCGFSPTAISTSLPRHPVAIAAITSCTNTSDPRLLITAGLLARKARRLGLKPAAWVKTSLAPGSPAAASYLERAGLLDDLSAVGFDIVGYGCTTCIGNPGPLPTQIRSTQTCGTSKGVAILSGNRNFPGRVHPELELSFIMSPALVIAYALSGDAELNLSSQPIQSTAEGRAVFLRELWPSADEIEAHLHYAIKPEDFVYDFAKASLNPLWHELNAPESACFPWDPESTTLRRPPFANASKQNLLGNYSAYPLLILGDDVTTDHLSPASAIPENSLIADYLVARGEQRGDLNVFASRRGNWEVMLRAAFHNKNLRNLLLPDAPVAHTLHIPSGKTLPIWEAAQRYHDSGDSVVLLAGERYGTGSSRDWAAKGQRLLGIRAVLAVSFERIHRSNLIGMGVLPLQFPAGTNPQTLDLQPGDQIEVDADASSIDVRGPVKIRIIRTNGEKQHYITRAAIETRLEIGLLRAGGVIPCILNKILDSSPASEFIHAPAQTILV